MNAAAAAAVVLLTACGGPSPEPDDGSAPATVENAAERRPVSPSSVSSARPNELVMFIPSCNGNPVVDELEEDDEQVRIRIVTTVVVSGDRRACADTLTVRLEEPLDGRILIDLVSEQPVTLGDS